MMRMTVFGSMGLLLVSTLLAADAPLKYPVTKRGDVVEELHGVKVADPYRWLEDDVRKSKDVAAWVEAQNKLTNAFFNSIPQREAIRERLTTLWNYERYSTPIKVAGRYFVSKNDGLQNQAVLYTLTDLDDSPQVLLDPNTWSKDGTVALGAVSISPDARRVAYSVADAGSDWTTIRIIDVHTREVLREELKWVKFSSPAWTADSRGFFYSRYEEPEKGKEFQGLNLNQKVWYHRLGTSQTDDELIYRRPDHPDWGFQNEVTEDGHFLIITTWKGTDDKYRVSYKNLAQPDAKIVDLVDDFEQEYSFLANDGPIFYFKTDLNAPRGRVVSIDIRTPKKDSWKEVIPQADEILQGVNLLGNLFVASYLKDARSQVKFFTLDGKLVREVELPGLGTVAGFSGKRTDTETFYSFSSFATPPSIYRYDVLTGKSTLFRRAKVDFNPDDFQVEQVFFPSKDGTKVPMFLAYKKGLKRDGSNPTLLYGYGGFNISLTPSFSVSRLAWMEMGGVFAMPNLRGGGEYGEEWHKAGTKLKKQNVFDDFIAAAQWLIDNEYTRPERLAIQGGSNGGLLVGAAMTQRPELFGAALPAVGVMDMLRFHKFTAGRYWVDDYGSPDDAKEFKALHAYSPFHNLKKGTKYPATLVTTADTDDRVVPGHSFKFIAMLQYSQGGDAPVLARIETRAGHGAGKPTAKLIEEVADQWAFLVKTLNVKMK